jgi:hypothetical protein
MPKDVQETLNQRGQTYGDFNEHARIAQNIKEAYRDSPNWETLPAYMKESLEMNAHKVARILNGNPFLHDSWHDVNGYTKLVTNILEEKDASE